MTRVRVKTAVCAIVLKTIGSVMSVKAKGSSVPPLLNQFLELWDQSGLVI